MRTICNEGKLVSPASSFAPGPHDPDWGAAVIPITLRTSLAFEEGRLPQRTPGSKSNPNKAQALKGLLRTQHY